MEFFAVSTSEWCLKFREEDVRGDGAEFLVWGVGFDFGGLVTRTEPIIV